MMIGLCAVVSLFCCGCTPRPHLSLIPPPWLDQKIGMQAMSVAPGAGLLVPYFHGATHDDDDVDWYVPLDYGRCYVFTAAGEETIEKIHLFLFNPARQRVVYRTREGATPRMSVCPQISGPFRLLTKVRGFGHYAVGVFVSDHPIAEVSDVSPNRLETATIVITAVANALGGQQPPPAASSNAPEDKSAKPDSGTSQKSDDLPTDPEALRMELFRRCNLQKALSIQLCVGMTSPDCLRRVEAEDDCEKFLKK
jgi:hypothetical protein